MVNVEKLVNDVSQALRAYYGADPMGAMGELERVRKDTRIVNLEGRAQVAEELVKKLQKEAGARNERWAIMVREVDKRNDRIAELQEAFEEAERLADQRLLQRQAAKKRAQSAEARKVEAEERAEAAEADRDWYRSVAAHNADAEKKAEDAKEDAEKLAEAAINEMHETERFAAAMRERAEKAEARVKDLKAENERLAKRYRKLGAFYELRELLDDDLATFTAPDGRVFRVGQRVYVDAEDYGTVRSFVGDPHHVWVDFPEERLMCASEYLRRVWDGSEEPDVPVGTVLRDAEGDTWKKTAKKQWTWVDVPGDFPVPWGQGMPNYGPYVEVLPGDDE